GVEYEVPSLKYKQLKAVWPRMKGTFDQMQKAKAEREGPSKDGVDAMFGAVDDSIFIIATALQRNPDNAHMTPEWVEDNLEPTEATAFPAVIMSIMTETGLIKAGKPDPAMAEAVVASLTATGTPSSPNSSQPESRE